MLYKIIERYTRILNEFNISCNTYAGSILIGLAIQTVIDTCLIYEKDMDTLKSNALYYNLICENRVVK